MSDERDDYRRFAREGWERAAPSYGPAWSSLTRRFVGPLLDAVGVGPGTRLLDLACGPGYVSEEAARRGATVLGVDFSCEMVRVASERCPGARFEQGDALELDLDARRFDAVACNFGVPHFADLERAFAGARRVLTPGGRFGFTVWLPPEDNPGMRLMREAIEAHGDTDVGLPEGPSSFDLNEEEACRRALGAAGFDAATVSLRPVRVGWTVPTPAFFFESERDGGVRTAGLLARQTPEALAAIEAEVARRVREYEDDDGFTIPMAAHVVSVSAPSSSAP